MVCVGVSVGEYTCMCVCACLFRDAHACEQVPMCVNTPVSCMYLGLGRSTCQSAWARTSGSVCICVRVCLSVCHGHEYSCVRMSGVWSLPVNFRPWKLRGRRLSGPWGSEVASGFLKGWHSGLRSPGSQRPAMAGVGRRRWGPIRQQIA